jgi:gliding motility-associated-like protein
VNITNCPAPNLTLTPPPISGFGVSPTLCGLADGYLKLYNLAADSVFSVSYTLTGTTTQNITADANDTITIPNLYGGNYTGIAASIFGSSCTVPPITLTNPPIFASETNPTICGKNDGAVMLFNLPADSSFTVTFAGPGSGSGSILTTAATDTLTIPGLIAGTFGYTAITASNHGANCVVAGPITLTDPPVSASFDTSIVLGCHGDLVNVTSTSMPAGYTNIWNFGDGGTTTTTAAASSHTYMDYPSYTGAYTIQLVYHTYGPGCYDTVAIPVSFNHPIAAVMSPVIDTVCLNPLTSINFTGSSSVGTGLQYNWNFGDGSVSNVNNPVKTYTVSGTYQTSLQVTDFVGCDSTVYGTVDVIKLNIATVTHDTTVCLVEPLMLIAHPDVYGISNCTYAWTPDGNLLGNTGDTVTYFMGVGDFSYTITATSPAPYNCQATDVEVIHSEPPLVLTNLTASQTITYGQSVQLNADGADYYYWYPATGALSNPNINNPIATPLDSTTFMVAGMNTYGCKDTGYVTILVNNPSPVFIPTGFTPNGDGLNDVFRVTNLKSQKLVEFRVFNRWGVQVFETSNGEQGWDGTYMGVPQDVGTYNYVVIIAPAVGVDNKVYTGTVTLIR